MFFVLGLYLASNNVSAPNSRDITTKLDDTMDITFYDSKNATPIRWQNTAYSETAEFG